VKIEQKYSRILAINSVVLDSCFEYWAEKRLIFIEMVSRIMRLAGWGNLASRMKDQQKINDPKKCQCH